VQQKGEAWSIRSERDRPRLGDTIGACGSFWPVLALTPLHISTMSIAVAFVLVAAICPFAKLSSWTLTTMLEIDKDDGVAIYDGAPRHSQGSS